MKISVAQIESSKGNIQRNIETHINWIKLAISEKVDLIVFPELSITGYEPELAQELAMDEKDLRLDEFQKISDANKILIGLGVPIKSETGILISMVIFQPKQKRKIYSKQILHLDEQPYFVKGDGQLILTVENKSIAPAICYESLQNVHLENSIMLGAEIYLASVAKSQNGVEKAYIYFPKIAEKYSIPVIMANNIGFCDTFLGAGQSAVWDKKGELIAQLDGKNKGLLIFDTETEQTQIVQYN